MPIMTVTIVEPAWPELGPAIKAGQKKLISLGNDDVIHVAVLEHGTEAGKPSICIRLDLPGNQVVLAETTLSMFLTTADILKARYGDPR